MRAKVHCEATPGSLIAKLLNNPHASLRREPMRHRLPVDTKQHKQRLKSTAAHGRHDSTPVADASLTAQRSLLDGGEGKLLGSYIDATDNDINVVQEIPLVDATTSNFPLLESPLNMPGVEASNLAGLKPPSLDSTGGAVTGADTPKHRIENKRRQKATLANQAIKSQWTIYQEEFDLPDPPTPLERHQGETCPSGMALVHPAANKQTNNLEN